MTENKEFTHIPLSYSRISATESLTRAKEFYKNMNTRRSVRFFSSDPIPIEIIENIILTAGTAPSGAHMQPWKFVVISDPEVKKQIRLAAEKEEKISYDGRMTEEWLQALAPIGTDWQKPFLEQAPYLIVVFKQRYGFHDDHTKKTHYYVSESVGIATGMLITAIHAAGLVTLTHTPSPMNFLREILGRPENESPMVLLPVGYPSIDATVPNLQRKPLSDIMIKV